MGLSSLVIAGTGSGVGKTSLTLGLIAALRRRRLTVQPFKIGPDFIDPLHHAYASGRPARTLDGWMVSPEVNRDRFAAATADADVAVIEGMMGLYDGSDGAGDQGSSAEMARLLGVSVVLVVDVWTMARSAAAVIHGYRTFDPGVRVVGVILNNVAGQAHADIVRAAVDGAVPVLGAIPRLPELAVPERHLGLFLPHEARTGYVSHLADAVEQHVDLDALLEVTATERPAVTGRRPRPAGSVTIAVARDEAFCFYYTDNLDLLRDAGAELVEFSPLRDDLPDGVDGLYIGGGYPELHAARLADNVTARASVRRLAQSGAPVYGECGGLMYLARTMTVDDRTHQMCGVLPFSSRIPAALQIGYLEVDSVGGPFGPRRARGHVFHKSEADGPNPHTSGNVLASYTHLHFASNPELAPAFVATAQRWRSKQ